MNTQEKQYNEMMAKGLEALRAGNYKLFEAICDLCVEICEGIEHDWDESPAGKAEVTP